MTARNQFTDEFKKSLTTLYQNGKSQAQISREYHVSSSALAHLLLMVGQTLVRQDFHLLG